MLYASDYAAEFKHIDKKKEKILCQREIQIRLRLEFDFCRFLCLSIFRMTIKYFVSVNTPDTNISSRILFLNVSRSSVCHSTYC